MILIKKRPDYYDFLVGVYGRDEKKVFNRREDLVSSDLYFNDLIRWRNTNIYDLLICERLYRVEQVGEGVWELHKFHKVNTDYSGQRRHYRESQVEDLPHFEYYIPAPTRMLTENPIAIKGAYHNDTKLEGLTPILSTFGIPSVLGAEELYLEIDMYIGSWIDKQGESTSHQDDKNKLTSKGFDDKISFRHRK